MNYLNPTPPGRLVDATGRPYFLWDTDQTLDAFVRILGDADPDVRAYAIAKLMRQARPDDVFSFVTLARHPGLLAVHRATSRRVTRLLDLAAGPLERNR